MLGYKSHFQFESQIQAFISLQRTSLVLLFLLADKVTKVIMEVKVTLDAFEAEIVDVDHVDACSMS